MRSIALLLTVAVAGCATAYQPYGLSGGFSEQYRGENAYRIRFEGNGYTRAAHVQEMAFLRAAELTLEKGFRYFVVLSEGADSRTIHALMPSTTTHRGSINSFGQLRGTSTTMGGMAIPIDMPSADLSIYMAQDIFSDKYVFHDAQDIVRNVGPKYKK